ncbi:MAG: glycosyltransferase family 2 protein [Elusimicrobia bacterium]|nr:glycosyltransferase family 2 protein [Elusimicrobiota bacterium]
MKISLVMIAKNEEKNIAKSLESVKDLVSEIIIVDSGSTDNTNKIAQSYRAKIFKRQFDNFSAQKNYALSLALNEWVLHLDADEVLSQELKEEIRQTICNSDKINYDGFLLTRENFFLGRKMKYSGIAREDRLRLAKKSLSKYVGGIIHEELVVDGKVGKFNNTFYHYTCSNLDGYFNKFEQYTTFGALKMLDKNKKAKIVDIIFRPPFEFIKRYILKLGFLDGLEGFVWAVLGSYYSFTKYIKLYLLQNKR